MTVGDKANNVVRIPTSVSDQFFRIFIEFLTPIHNLTDREKDVLAEMIKQRFILAESIKNDEIIDKIMMSNDIRNKIKETCGVSNAFLQVIMGKLRKTGILVNDKINPKFIPKNLNREDKSFKFLVYFDLDGK